MASNLRPDWIKQLFIWVLVTLSFVLLCSTSYAAVNMEGIQIYSKNAAPAEKKERLALDISRYHSANANLWDVLRTEFSLTHYEQHTAVQENIGWFLDNQDFLIRTTNRAAPYLYFIHEQIKQYKLPVEMVLIPVIESGYNPFTLSTSGAAGIWQMMPGTASGFGVKQDWWYDGRRDVVVSTHAALEYLSYLFDFFDGNALLAIAAYNTGEGSVMSAIRRNIRDGKSTDFWSLPLPRETRTYVPRLLALATIIAHPEAYPVVLPKVRNAPYLAQIDVGGQIDLKRAASFAGMSLKQFQQLNPGYNRLVTHPNGPYKLVLPIENVEQFMSRLSHTSVSQHIDWVQYKVKSRDTLDIIAKTFNTTTSSLREINHLRRAQLKKGMRLVIPRTVAMVSTSPPKKTEELEDEETTTVAATEEKTAEPLTEPAPALASARSQGMQSGDTLYMVRRHDTIEKIAERYNLPPKMVYAANNLHSYSVIQPGDQLLLPTHLASKMAPKDNSSDKEPDMRRLVPGDTLYMVRAGDTLEKIAQKFKTTPAAIRVANLMSDSRLTEGAHVIVPTHMLKGKTQGQSLPLELTA